MFRAMLSRALPQQLRRLLVSVVLYASICTSAASMAANASERCTEETKLKFEFNPIALNADSIEYRMSIKNLSDDAIEINRESIPWLQPGSVSVVLLDWKSGGSIEEWVDQSRLKFTIGGQGQQRGAFFPKYVRDLIDSVQGILNPGQALTSTATLSVTSSDLPLAGTDFERLRQEGVFLWTARTRTQDKDCLQSGISKIE